MNTFIEFIQAYQTLITGGIIAIFLAAYVMKQDHEWNRRKYAVDLFKEWGIKTIEHRRYMEFELPEIFKKWDHPTVGVSEDVAKEIYFASKGTKYWDIRFRLLELGWYFESISIAYKARVAKKEIVEQSLKRPLIRWYRVMEKFIFVIEEELSYNPWKEFDFMIKEWCKEDEQKSEEAAMRETGKLF